MADNPVFLILDGHNLVYRSFFAVRGLTTADGRPSNALFGFIKSTRALRELHAPTHQCAVFDGGLPAGRMALLETYKAQRPPMPEELRAQLPAIEEYLSIARIPVCREPAQEADDVIATLAAAAARDGARVRIVSNDKDLMQLVNDRVELVPPAGADAVPLDAAGVLARTGVAPGLIVDWLALTGDTVDNIPGVPGIGPRTATKLLNDFGSIEALWNRLPEVASDRIRGLLAEHRPIVERNRELMRLHDDLPLPVDWRDCGRAEPETAALRSFYARWDFQSLARELDQPMLW